MRKAIIYICILMFMGALWAQTKPLTVTDVLQLKELGYSDEEILQELKETQSQFDLTPAEIQALKDAGIGEELLQWMINSKPVPKITVENIIAWVKAKEETLVILERIFAVQGAFIFGPQDLLALKKGGVPTAIILAAKNQSLVKNDLLQLAAEKANEDVLRKLLQTLGTEYQPKPTESLDLIRKGLPRTIVKELGQGKYKGIKPPEPPVQPIEPVQPTEPVLPEIPPPVEPKPPEITVPMIPMIPTIPAGDYLHYEHVGKAFGVEYPMRWQPVVEIKDGNVTYAFTPQVGTLTIDKVYKGISLQRMIVNAGSSFYRLSTEAMVQRISRILQAQEPGVTMSSTSKQVDVNGVPGYKLDFQGTLNDFPGQGVFVGWLTIVQKDSFVYMITGMAPQAEWASIAPTADAMLSKIRLGRPELSQRDKTWTAQELVEVYKESVVSVVAGYENKPIGTGSGFIIREDGYLVTNHHVVWDDKAEKFYTHFTIEWDSTTKKPAASAVLVGARRESGGHWLQSLTTGGADIALLKIVEGGPYKPVTLTSFQDIQLGDSVVAMGFPRRDLFDAFGSSLSIFITKGGIVRFNRDENDRLKSIYTDAKITHGNSGGPCFDLSTGGVFGINTFGAWHGIEQSEQSFRDLQLGDLVGYYGVIPIQYVFDEFPQYSRYPAEYDQHFGARDYIILAREFFMQGLYTAALKEVNKALEKAPSNADALYLKGFCHANLKEYKETLDAWNKALKYNPQHYDTLLTMAWLYCELKEYLKASDYIEQAVAVKPKNYQGYLQRGRIYLAIERYAEAMEDAKQAQTLTHGMVPEPWVLAGQICYAQSKLDEGKKTF